MLLERFITTPTDSRLRNVLKVRPESLLRARVICLGAVRRIVIVHTALFVLVR